MLTSCIFRCCLKITIISGLQPTFANQNLSQWEPLSAACHVSPWCGLSVRDAPKKFTSNKWIGMFFAPGKYLATMASLRILSLSHAEEA
jgi:hypothetical protein